MLATAHLDHNPRNNRRRNLRALCQRCHLIHERPRHLRQRWITCRRRYAIGDLFLGLYAGVYFLAVATPGPGIAALVARVFAHGLKGVGPFILGFVVGDLIWLTVAATGLAVLAREFASVFVALRFAGAA